MDKSIENRIVQLEQKLKTLESKYAVHQHNDTDGTNHLRKNIVLDADQSIAIGPSQQITSTQNRGQSSELNAYVASVGPDSVTSGFVNKSKNMQMEWIHAPNTAGTSRFRGYASPLVTAVESTSLSTTAGGSTVTIAGFNFTTNELAGAFIAIVDGSTGVIIEQQVITSNTSTVVTITSTWINSSSNAKFLIYRPLGLGDQVVNFRILYVGENDLPSGTAAGIRFGGGLTSTSAGGQNGFLYMDAAGDLYWRPKATAVAVKLN
jgi:hypothetical protein